MDETPQFDFTVAAGNSFCVWDRLVGTADQIGEVDAFSTRTASFTNTVGRTPAAVPGPAIGRLLANADLALRARRRRAEALGNVGAA